MPELSSTVENDPPATPTITTRAKVVRESFTVLRSDFEPSPAPPVTRPQKQDAAPTARGGQSNVALSIGGGIVLVGGIFAFLFFGYGSNKSAATAAKPTAKASGAAVAAVPADVVKDTAKTHPHEAHSETQTATRKTAPIAEHRAVSTPAHKAPDESAAARVAIPRPRELHNLPRESQPIARVPHEKMAVAAPPKPAVPRAAPHVEAPMRHAEHTSHAPAQGGGHHEDSSSELDPLHSLGN